MPQTKTSKEIEYNGRTGSGDANCSATRKKCTSKAQNNSENKSKNSDAEAFTGNGRPSSGNRSVTRLQTAAAAEGAYELLGEAAKRCDQVTRYNLLERVLAGVVDDDLRESFKGKQGWIYIYRHKPGKPSEFKIGKHVGPDPRDRIRQWEKKCGREIELVRTWEVAFARTTELFIETELKGMDDVWLGSRVCRGPEDSKCTAHHREWYKASKQKLFQVISYWVDYTNRMVDELLLTRECTRMAKLTIQ
ncbi:hypothetical protein Agub_g15001 [Astrephomene gubernaculifera]|uniref:Uncharacterized protein n=1 Tax=Astrephomene gubernaculifera TaxID=47775 RepID=A0AAD3HSQ3_9CHLO|nr:hypothetical protein Agub_g15001 [Astrephomene gubernaculifera]